MLKTEEPNTYSCSLIENWDDFCTISINTLCQSIRQQQSTVLEAIKYLEKNNYIEYNTLKSSTGPVHTGFHLSHKGLHFKEFERIKLKEYVADKWIDFLALAVAIVAFIQSCIALSMR